MTLASEDEQTCSTCGRESWVDDDEVRDFFGDPFTCLDCGPPPVSMALSPAEFATKAREAAELGTVEGHEVADELALRLLRHLGYGEGADVIASMPKWFA